MDKQQTIKEIRKYPLIYLDDCIQSLVKMFGIERAKTFIDLEIERLQEVV